MIEQFYIEALRLSRLFAKLDWYLLCLHDEFLIISILLTVIQFIIPKACSISY